MAEKLHLTLACGDYESIRALKEGVIQPDGIELTVLTDMDSSTRHWRIARFREFDVGEHSGSSYLLAKDRGEADDLTAIPVFLHRRFRHGFIFVNADKGIQSPKDLIGKTVGLKNWQATALLWIRGTLQDEYGVSFTDLEWRAEREEDVPFDPPEGLRMERLPKGKRVEEMLAEGELDAVIHPDILAPILEGDTRVKRLFDDPKQVEMDYFKRTGIFPIMHTTVIKREIVEKYPWVPMNMMVAFEKAKQWTYNRMNNPRIVPLAFFRDSWEEQLEQLGEDPWVYGLNDTNRHNFGTLARYSREQGMIRNEPDLDELFHESVRGEEWKLARSRG